MNEYKDESIHFWIEEGILKSEFLKSVVLDLDFCEKIINIRHQVSNNEKQYWLYDFRNVADMTTEGRKYAEKYGQDNLHATAAIVNSHLTKFIVNLFRKINNPRIPFRAFKDMQEALEWLKDIKKENENG